jgi:RND family efflux transporter MFP subunit
MEAEVRIATAPDRVFRAPVDRISPVVDPMSRTAALRMMIDNADHLLRPGSLADVRIEVDRRDNAIMVPQYSLVLTDQEGENGEARYAMYVVEGEVARQRLVTLGFYDHNEVEVREGLADGDRYVVQGQHLLRDGSRVRIETRRNGGPARAAVRRQQGGE